MRTRASQTFIGPSVAALALLASGVAQAHFSLVEPKPADSTDDGGKGAPPCGPTTSSGVINTDQDGKPLMGGHPLRISVSETVLHPGHYRFAFGATSRTEIPADPDVVVKNNQSVSATIQDPAVYPVLADGVFVHTTGTPPISFTTTITLPNIKCTKCTLQVIEFMAMHGPNPGGGYFYHHCADLQYDPDPSLPADGGVGDASTDTGGGATGGRAGSGGLAGGGGRSGNGGSGTGGDNAGGSGGVPGTGGANTGGNDAGTGSGGAPGTGGTGTGGAITSTGGQTGTGGTIAGSGGMTGSGGSTVSDAGTTGANDSAGGCGCAIANRGTGVLGTVGLVLVGLFWLVRRRRG
jgi:MYXO-CTERM domain-containing protein